MWWKITLMVLVLMAIFFVVGLYAGGAFFLRMTGDQVIMAWDTLWNARLLPLSDRRLFFLPWAWSVTAAITFLPAGLVLMAMVLRLKPKTSLHGDARFANDRELRQFEYQGEYKNTNKK